MQPREEKIYFVSLEFPLEKGIVKWDTHVTAVTPDHAVKAATEWFWSQLDYRGIEPQFLVRDVYEDPAGADRAFSARPRPDEDEDEGAHGTGLL